MSPNSYTNSLAHSTVHIRPNAITDDLSPHPNPDNTTNNFKVQKCPGPNAEPYQRRAHPIAVTGPIGGPTHA